MRGLNSGLAFVMGRAQGLQVFVVVGATERSRVDVIDVAGALIALVDHANVVVDQVASTKALPCRVVAALCRGGAARAMLRTSAGGDQLGTAGLRTGARRSNHAERQCSRSMFHGVCFTPAEPVGPVRRGGSGRMRSSWQTDLAGI